MSKTKKIFAAILALTLIVLTSTVFAADEVQESMNKAGSNIKNVVEGAGNVVKDGAAAVGNGVKDLGDTVKNGVNGIETGAKDLTAGTENAVGGMTRNMDGDTGYTATRTATGGTFMGMNGTTWTWFILAIAALAIIGLVWYYAMQNSNEYSRDHHND